MKTVVILCVALVVVMAKPQEKVQVVDPGYYQGGNTNGVNVVDNPDPGFYQGGNNNGVSVIDNPDPGFYQGGNNGVHVVDGPQGGNNGVIVVENPDPGYYQGGNLGAGVIQNPDSFYYGGNPGGQQLRPYPHRPRKIFFNYFNNCI
ncbi:uncharacterized protein LOC126374569 isoform X11 [Pectinophora gossypiella]|uniref:uncharacterized protein LOC126374569 isoform X11 n=1 Tax=Pectinophora gossypiella TaxID=13191 RepID=UPI00214E5CE9|nr:uncharacterized protein LOC126374569 isoform X11 [Pectinophora gossypiella]